MSAPAAWDRRCHVCWDRIYALWVDEGEPQTCPWGHTRATDCANAMAGARNSAKIIKLRAALTKEPKP